MPTYTCVRSRTGQTCGVAHRKLKMAMRHTHRQNEDLADRMTPRRSSHTDPDGHRVWPVRILPAHRWHVYARL